MKIRRLVKRLGSRTAGRAAMLLLATGLSVCVDAGFARAQNSHTPNLQYFRIGTGPTTGIYFPVGALIASMVSNPPGSRPCDRGGSCGVPGLIAVAQATQDSVERLQGVADRRLDSGLVQADVAYLAFHGQGPFAGKPLRNLRAIAALYTEYLHVVVRTGAGIRSFADLKGRRVGLDLDGSGTRLMVQMVFPLLGIPPSDLRIETLGVTQAGDRLRARRLDTFAFTSGIPAEPIQRLTEDTSIGLLSVPARVRERIASSGTGIFAVDIPAGTYKGIPATPTLGTRALWVVPAETDPELVYELTRALWHPNNQRLLASGPAAARAMRVQDATADLTIPLHSGAERYYREAGYAVPSVADTPRPAQPARVPPPPPPKPPEHG